MKNNELYKRLNNLKKDYYELLGSHETGKSFEEFNENFNINIVFMVVDYIRLHKIIIEKNTLDYDLCSAISEIGVSEDNYQVQLCAIGNKNLWIENIQSILMTRLKK